MAESSSDGNFLSDTFSSAKELITERFSSPFIFSYVISWLLINYKAVILTFTDTTENFQINTKIDLIESCIQTGHQLPFFQNGPIFSSFLLAFFVACFYTFAYPFIDYGITQFTLNRKVSIRNLRVRAESTIVHSAEYVDKIYLRHARAEKDLRARLEGAEITENQLRAVLKDLEEKLNQSIKAESSTSEVKTTSEPIEVETKLELARAFIEMDDAKSAEELLNEIKLEGSNNQRRRANTLLKKISNMNKSIVQDDKDNTYDETEVQLIETIGEMHNRNIALVPESIIKKTSSISVVDFNLAVTSLINKGVISRKFRDQEYKLKLEENGLRAYKKMHLTK